ncbi:MAG: hypothetical protein ACFHWX_20175 [Bacteroidota bacterium]
MLTGNRYLLLWIVAILAACSSGNESNNFEGTWKAVWETDPSGYPGISDQLDFTMSGIFQIESDSLTIEGYGYKGCIFSEDTIHHKLVWKIKNDSLLLFNEPGTPGLVYKIVESKNDMLKLQLEDIYVTLTK